MQTYFYSHIVSIEPIKARLDELELSDTEKEELLTLSEENLHYVVMDVVLSELTDEDKKTLFIHLASDKHDDVWALLHDKTDKIEEKIMKAAEEFINTLHKDVHEAKKITKKKK